MFDPHHLKRVMEFLGMVREKNGEPDFTELWRVLTRAGVNVSYQSLRTWATGSPEPLYYRWKVIDKALQELLDDAGLLDQAKRECAKIIREIPIAP